MRKNLILFWAICLLPTLFYSCENLSETTKEDDEENEKAAINLVLTSKNWTVTSYKTNFNESMELKEQLNVEASYTSEEFAIEGGGFCRVEHFSTLKNINIKFTSKESETQTRFARRDVYSGNACDPNSKSGNLHDTTLVYSSTYTLNTDSLLLIADFGNRIDPNASMEPIKIRYNIVNYTSTRIELAGELITKDEEDGSVFKFKEQLVLE